MWKLRHDVVTGDLIDKKTFTSDSKRWGAFFCLSKYISSTWFSCRANKNGFPGLADFLAKVVGVIEEKKSIDKITEQLKPDKFEPKEKKRWQKEAKDAINEISNSVQTDLKPAEHYGVVQKQLITIVQCAFSKVDGFTEVGKDAEGKKIIEGFVRNTLLVLYIGKASCSTVETKSYS